MNPAAIIRKAEADGVKLALSPSGTIKATGDSVVVNRWLSSIREQKAGIVEALADAMTSWGWRLHFSDRDPLEVYCNPDATHAEILKRYPDARAAEPIPERIRRTPTEAEATELRALVQAIDAAEKWPVDEIEWAMDGALADPDGALICYRALAVEHGIILPLDDDRRTCSQCVNLTGRGRCLSAWRGELVANRDYYPIRDLPRRCEGYTPGQDEPDRRPGNERWPGLIEKGGDHG